MIDMMLGGMCLCVLVFNSGSAQTYVTLIPFNDIDPLIAFVTLFLLFKMVTMVEWYMHDWRAITSTDFPPL
jgi:hypothetical protein